MNLADQPRPPAGCHTICFAGETMVALPGRALFWPRHRALIVADLHLEKASWFAARGQPLPPYDSHDTLTRLAALARTCTAHAIWCLGDSFHDHDAAARIDAANDAALRRLGTNYDLCFVAGNHDGLTGGAWGGTAVDEMVVGGIVLRHQSVAGETRPELSGHFHPKVRVAIRGRTVARACFAADSQRMILPAFGTLTGGLDVADAAIAACFTGAYDAIVATGSGLAHFPVQPAGPARAVTKMSHHSV